MKNSPGKGRSVSVMFTALKNFKPLSYTGEIKYLTVICYREKLS